ncbi:hypothetical protein COCNU_16G000170 [Cocos nucifera]|uniref:Uncharacterized protein n=1 Tax=Cocos nucifera TaxID=13894 RepID=A0A8K0NDE2_COCNU|nr:hypothetical protein COCNU_16G000170 [Cocos nucifera]
MLKESKRISMEAKEELAEMKSALEEAKFDLASKKEKRKAIKFKATKFVGEDFNAGFETYRQRVESHYPELNLAFLEDELDDLPMKAEHPTIEPSTKVREPVEVPPAFEAEAGFLEGEHRNAKKEIQHLDKNVCQSKSHGKKKISELMSQLLIAEQEIDQFKEKLLASKVQVDSKGDLDELILIRNTPMNLFETHNKDRSEFLQLYPSKASKESQ